MPHYINAEYKYMQNCIYKYVTIKLLKQATNIISNSKYLKHFVVEKLGIMQANIFQRCHFVTKLCGLEPNPKK